MTSGLPLRDGYLERPDPSRLSPSHPRYEAALAAHAAAVAAGSDTYRDPISGFEVFTAAWLVARGTCCDNACRHCPYVGA